MRLYSGLCILIILVMAAGISAAPASPDNERFSRPADKIISPSAPTPEAPYIRSFNSPPPRRDDIIGEAFEAGNTWYDYQSNGSIGKFIAKDPLGVIHVTWMDGYDDQVATRHQKYNWFEDDEWRRADGMEIANDDRSGYGCLWMSEEGDDSRPIAFFHGSGGDFGDEFIWAGAIDFDRLFGAFMVSAFPAFPNVSVGWPQGVATSEGAIHVFGNDLGDNAEGRLAYLPALINEDGEIESEVDFPFEVGETHMNTYRIARSRVSERVAVTWITYRGGLPVPDHWAGLAVSQMNNDLMMAFTDEDGENWNFDDPVNITRTIRPNIELEGSDMYGDTLLPYCTHDIIFDSEDNIHVVFDTRLMKINPQDDEDEVSPPIDGVTFDASYLFHWSEETDEFSVVADGYFSQAVLDDDGEIIAWPAVGAWKSNVCYPSLAYDEEGDLYCVFNYYPHLDFNDIGNNGFSHGDVAMTVSEDNGASCYDSTMVVETRSHLPEPGEAFNEIYPTIAERIDDDLHIFYEIDKEAGTPIQEDGSSFTLNPFYYQRIPKDQIERDEIVEGPDFHISFRPQVTDAERDPEVPTAGNPVVATANVTPPGGSDIESVTLQYRVDEGDVIEVAMENVGGDVWAGTIPAQDDGAWVWYRIRAEDTAGLDAYSPSSTWWFSYTPREDGGLKVQDIQRISLDWGVDYSGYRGYEVTVQGIVTTPFTFNEQYGAYVIQDADGGEWSGVMLRGIEEDLSEGDLLTVTGTVMERDEDDATGRWRFATYLDVSSYEVIDQVDKPEPMAVDLGDIVWAERGEHLESVFVQVFDFKVEELDSTDQAAGLWKIFNNTGSSWFTTNGLTEDDIEDRGLTTDEMPQGAAFTWMKGIVAEGHRHYAFAPTKIEELSSWVTVEEENTTSPANFSLHPAYPNPFNATTTIGFDLGRAGMINLSIYDLAGRVVADLLQQEMSAGNHEFTLEASALSAGIYILRLETDSRAASQKIVLIK